MIAMRYGTPPIVRRTGGLADTVVDVTRQPGSGTGFVFDVASPEALLTACHRAFELRAKGGMVWERLIDRVMAADFDWSTGAAPRYIEAYRRAVEIRRGTI
jgi:starch synthase